jgi:hypothetical protein
VTDAVTIVPSHNIRTQAVTINRNDWSRSTEMRGHDRRNMYGSIINACWSPLDTFFPPWPKPAIIINLSSQPCWSDSHHRASSKPGAVHTVHSTFSIWSEPDEHGISLLERALKKSGGRGPYPIGAQRRYDVLDHRRAEREEHGHGGIDDRKVCEESG